MNIPLVDLSAQYQSIKREIDHVISEVISTSAFIGGKFVESFETAFARFSSAKHCISVGNGTDALYIALRALGIGRGDEVITAANSFIATAEAVSMTGARVVFVDIDPRTYNIDAGRIESKITGSTKAIVPVHLYGQPADMTAISKVAQKYSLKIVEDAAQAHAAVFSGRPIGTMGVAGCFSFYPGKNLGAYGDGGAILTNDDALAVKMRMIANHGRVSKYDHELEGVNSRLDGLQAAILDVKLRHLQEWTDARRRNAYLYNELLRHPGLITPDEIRDSKCVYHLYVVRVKENLRDKLQAHLHESGISTGIHYPIPLPNLKAYAHIHHDDDEFIHSEHVSREILSLPMYAELDEGQVSFISRRIIDFLTKNLS